MVVINYAFLKKIIIILDKIVSHIKKIIKNILDIIMFYKNKLAF